MEPENSPIGKHFRDAFADFKREPSPDLWDKIARHPDFPKPVSRPSIGKLAYVSMGIAGVVILSILAVYLLKDSPQENLRINTIQKEMSSQKPASSAVDQGSLNTRTTAAEPISQETRPSGTQDVPGHSAIAAKPGNSGENAVHVSVPEVAPISSVPATNAVQSKPFLQNTGSKTRPVITVIEPSAKPGSSEPLSISSDTLLCRGEYLTLEAKGGDSYTWNTGESTAAVIVNPTETTIYSVTATSNSGRQLIREIEVKVVDCKKLNVPNAFTPNADGVNDIFEVFGNDIQDFYIIILSRTGQIVYESKDLKSGWDGSLKGKPAELGVYIYRIEYKDQNGITHKQNGQITLLR